MFSTFHFLTQQSAPRMFNRIQSPRNLQDSNLLQFALTSFPLGPSIVFRPLLSTTLILYTSLNRLKPNDPYMGRTAPLTSKRCILYIYATNVSTEYFKHALYSPFFSLQIAVCFIMLTCLVPVLFTFYIQGVLKLK